jgi:hypothetical protein
MQMMTSNETAEPAMIAAIVRAPDGVRFTATGLWANDVVPALAAYVAERCEDVLWPAAAAEVRRLIDGARPSRAIAAYFEHVGARWDAECLELYVVTAPRDAIWRNESSRDDARASEPLDRSELTSAGMVVADRQLSDSFSSR